MEIPARFVVIATIGNLCWWILTILHHDDRKLLRVVTWFGITQNLIILIRVAIAAATEG